MRYCVFILALLIISAPVTKSVHRPKPPFPNQFAIALQQDWLAHGPAGDYELFVVSPIVNGSLIEKITLTPAECVDPASFEYDSVAVSESAMDILGSKNPCEISEKEIASKTRRRQRDGLTSIGVGMQVPCENQTRLIPSETLDKVMSRPVLHMPEHVSWTTLLFERMDQGLGKTVFDLVPPLLKMPDHAGDESRLRTLRAVSEGTYDELFQGASERPSNLYRLSQTVPAHPAVELVSALPIQPEAFALPVYPQLARQARVWGSVSFKFDVNSDGVPANLTIESGPPMLREAVMRAVSVWRFPNDASGQQIQATIGFGLGCFKSTDCP